jgi:hypothetical protein
VFRSLQREREGFLWTQVGEQFPTESQEAFSEAAKRWLGDKSQLAGRTIEEADWAEIYRHFKALKAEQ